MKKHVNPAKFLHKVYTEQGGVRKYNKNQQVLGILKFAGALFFRKNAGSKANLQAAQAGILFPSTYNDTYASLVEYNKNPYDLEPSITVKELYVKWTQEYFKTLKADGSIRGVTSGLLLGGLRYARERCPCPSYKRLYGRG